MSQANWCEICKTQVYTTWLTSGIQDEGAPRNVLAQHHKKNCSNQPPKLARLSAAALHQANLKKHSQDNEHEEAPQESDDEGHDQGRAARHSKSTGEAKPDTMAYYKGTHWWAILKEAKITYRRHIALYHGFPDRDEDLGDAHDILLEAIKDYQAENKIPDQSGFYLHYICTFTYRLVKIVNQYAKWTVWYVKHCF